MPMQSRTWQEKLAIIDNTMKAISSVTDPDKLVEVYYNGVGSLMPGSDYVAMSRRRCEKPDFVITRSSRFTVHPNPFTEWDKLPHLSGGLLGEIAYADAPVIIDNLPARLAADDPGHFYLQGFDSLVALPQYEDGLGINITIMLLKASDGLDASIIPMLHWQAGLFGRGTRNLVLRNELGKAWAALDRELQTVGEIQRDLLPSVLPEIPGFEIATHYLTSARAGGDYYDFFPLADGTWGLFIADVSGHGTPAAVLMAITHALAHAHPGKHTPPAQLLHYLNDRLTRSYTRGGTFITAFYAVLDPVKKTLTYARAGHNPPRLVRACKALSLDTAGALPLGILEEQSFDEFSVPLQSGDLLLLYTDGITETMAPAKPGTPHELFGVERLDRLLLECDKSDAGEAIRCIKAAIAEFSHFAPPKDDQTLIAIRCL